MQKHLTQNQIIGEIGENAVRGRFLTMGYQFDGRSRLEAGIDGVAEAMDNGQPNWNSTQMNQRLPIPIGQRAWSARC